MRHEHAGRTRRNPGIAGIQRRRAAHSLLRSSSRMRTSHDGRAASLNPRMTGHSSIEAATAERPEAVADSQHQELPGGGGKRAAPAPAVDTTQRPGLLPGQRTTAGEPQNRSVAHQSPVSWETPRAESQFPGLFRAVAVVPEACNQPLLDGRGVARPLCKEAHTP